MTKLIRHHIRNATNVLQPPIPPMRKSPYDPLEARLVKENGMVKSTHVCHLTEIAAGHIELQKLHIPWMGP